MKMTFSVFRMSPLEQKLFDFCNENPKVAFDAPPEFQEKFLKNCSEFGSSRMRNLKIFYYGTPIKEFFEGIEEGAWLLIFAKFHDGFFTFGGQFARYVLRGFYPRSDKIYFQGGPIEYLISPDIVAVVKSRPGVLEGGSCFDPEAEIFMSTVRSIYLRERKALEIIL